MINSCSLEFPKETPAPNNGTHLDNKTQIFSNKKTKQKQKY